MSGTLPERRSIPVQRAKGCPFDPPPELSELRETEPVCPVTMPDGTDGWLLTRYDDIYATLRNHETFSSRGELRTSPIGTMLFARRPAEVGNLAAMDPPDHTRLRRKLQGKFTTKRVARLADPITQIVNERLDEMERMGAPVDLVETYSLPIPSLVICELLGVPYGDREEFQSRTASLLKVGSTMEEYGAAIQGILDIIHELARHKRAHPTDDILSELAQDEELSPEEAAFLGLALLVAGHETTANMIALSTFALLQHPDQLALLREDPAGRIDNAVEELLRYLTVPQFGGERAALQDVEVRGRQIKKGDVVVPALMAANRDPECFEDPHTFDIGRSAATHLAFGFGVHQCVGQQLARVEMRIAIPALLERFPTLRLGAPADEIEMRTNSFVYGVAALPVAW
ncbi:cytochrome P450 [Streptomyces canus]|uniref:cytochrome P450 n=1 Tax=Streptomyces canus TaxID=58343 RepID=UPI0027851CC8|nr:cytochrome P450 [Streptomyces canus]MDQ0595712.1 cytochrome P450 [Streptomyces canus]